MSQERHTVPTLVHVLHGTTQSLHVLSTKFGYCPSLQEYIRRPPDITSIEWRRVLSVKLARVKESELDPI